MKLIEIQFARNDEIIGNLIKTKRIEGGKKKKEKRWWLNGIVLKFLVKYPFPIHYSFNLPLLTIIKWWIMIHFRNHSILFFQFSSNHFPIFVNYICRHHNLFKPVILLSTYFVYTGVLFVFHICCRYVHVCLSLCPFVCLHLFFSPSLSLFMINIWMYRWHHFMVDMQIKED